MQGRGMAKELLRSLERYAANNGYSDIIL
ncbi:hypothetical protein [Caldifermentibacillus hisashii]